MTKKSEDVKSVGYKKPRSVVTKPKCRVVEAYARLVSNATKQGRERELPKCALKSAYYIVLDQS